MDKKLESHVKHSSSSIVLSYETGIVWAITVPIFVGSYLALFPVMHSKLNLNSTCRVVGTTERTCLFNLLV